MNNFNAKTIMENIECAKQIMRDNIQVLMVSTNFARMLIKSEQAAAIPTNILFILDDHCDDDKALVLQGELKVSMLQGRDDGVLTLYTLDQLRVFTCYY